MSSMTANHTAPLSLIIDATSQPKWLMTSLDKVLSAVGLVDVGLVITSPSPAAANVPEPPMSLEEALELLSFSGDPADPGPPPAPAPDPPLESATDLAPDTYTLTLTLEALSEVVIDLPGLEGVGLVLNPGGFEAHLTAAGEELSLAFTVGLGVRLSPNLLRPMRQVTADDGAVNFEDDPSQPYVQITLASVTVEIDAAGAVDVVGGVGVQLDRPVMIGDTGVLIESADIDLNFSGSGPRPAGTPEGWKGLLINQASVRVPGVFSGAFTATGLGIGAGGVSGTIGTTFALSYADGGFTGDVAGEVFGMPGGLESVSLTLQQNVPAGGGVKAKLLLPFFDQTDKPLDIDIGLSAGGAITVAVGSPDGILNLTKPGVLSLQLESIGFEFKDGVFVAKLSGQITPLVGADKGLKWPGFKVEELSIDSEGHVRLQGGWLDLREQYELDFNGFKVSITKLGFGKTEDGGKWVGFSGGLKLVDGFTAGASVEGLRVTWYEDGRTKISFDGIGVEFEVPGVLKFKGAVAYRELLVNGEEVRRFDGDITLELVALELVIDAKLVIGRAGGSQGEYNFFAIYLGVELPTGIPLSPLPLALYGVAGLFALQMEPNKTAAEEWYEGWYKRPAVGVTDLTNKWGNRRGSLALGGGVTIGTTDNGFTFACKALLVIVFPGPIIMLEGKANLLKDRAELGDEPMFRSLAVLDMRQKEMLIGLDARYRQDETSGKVIDIRAGVEAYFSTPSNWHIYLGEREPREKRIRAEIFKLFEANSYFMIDPKQLATGAWVGYARRWKFGPVGLTLEAWLEGNAVVNWNPLHFHGDLWLHGLVEVNVFRFSLGLGVDARFAADVRDPFHVVASFEVSVKLPKPLKKKHFDIKLEWGPDAKWPIPLPSPLKEVAVEHFKTTTTWPLDAHKSAGPPTGALPVVPLDCRPHVSFRRPVHDDALVGVNPQPPQPTFERIGDPAKNEGPVSVRYGLQEVGLLKWEPQTQQWGSVAVAGRPPAGGERTLYGSWAAVPQLPSGAGQPAVANDKLWLWSKTPFDYTRHGGSDGDDWFTENFPTYPCVPQDIPDREVCCDFEKLDRTDVLESGWRSPEHPEITLRWEPRAARRVTVLDPPDKGFTRALCFPARTQVSSPGFAPRFTPVSGLPRQTLTPVERAGFSTAAGSAPLTIDLSEPAKRVKVWVAEAKKAGKVCLDFRNRPRTQVRLPFNEQGVEIGPGGMTTTIAPVQTTLGSMSGLNCTFPSDPTRPPGQILINLPCAATTVELIMSYQSSPTGTTPPSIAAFNSAGEQVAARAMLNPVKQPEMVRFEGKDLKRIRIFNTVSAVYLHRFCFLCAETPAAVTAEGFDREGRRSGSFESRDHVVEVTGENLTRVTLSGRGEICLLKVCAVFGPDPQEVADRKEMAKHLQSEVARWSQEGEVLEPFSTYRLRVVTRTQAYGVDKLAGQTSDLTDVTHFDFRTEGPPGLTKLSVPAGQNADQFDSGLEDLTRYVRQTTPATVPSVGEKPVMAKPFYRAYDVEVEFNEDYVDLMYRSSGRDLGLYLYDSNNRPVRDAEGRLLTQSGDWGAVEELTLTEGEQRWLALAAAENRCLPAIEESGIVRDRKLTSAVAGRVLEPDVVYEARLIPLLLREGFAGYMAGAAAQGPSGRLGRWRVLDEGEADAPSHWEVRETPAPVARYLIQTGGIKGGSDDPADPFKPGTLLLYGDDPALDPTHPEQPSNWTDYRLNVYLRADAGAIGLVFRHSDANNCYRVSMDRAGGYRRLVSFNGGALTVLAEDAFMYEPQRDYLFTVEAAGDALRVYQDGAPVFDVTDSAHAQGGVGLYAYDNTGARFADVRVDDFRQTAQAVYRFPFTTSLFANFFHHLHSYQDETWRVAFEEADVVGALPAVGKAVPPATPPSDDEARAYETLANALLGPAARQNPREVQVTRVDIDGAPLAYLVQSPEPIDWRRTSLDLLRTEFARTEPALPGRVKLAAVNFGQDRASIDSVVLLLREPLNLTGYRIESRLAAWPLSPESGVVINTQTLPPDGVVDTPWTTYRTLEAGKTLPAGTTLSTAPPAAGPPAGPPPAPPVGADAASVERSQRILFSRELRVVAPDGTVVHSRHFLPDDDYAAEEVRVLRKADGTGFFMVKPRGGSFGVPFAPGQYRLKLTYRRENRDFDPASRILSQAGERADEVVTIDIPLQTQ
jgi:hypothetical protein